MMINRSRITVVQTTSIIGDVAANAALHCEHIRQAIAEQAEAVIFPELSLTGYTLRDLNFEVAIDPATDPRLQELRELSRAITIICGGVERAASGGVYNSAFVFEDGMCIHTHHKMYPPDYGIFEEQRYFLRGDTLSAFDSRRLGRMGVLVCEDLWHPSLPYLLAYQGAQCVITIAASPTRLAVGEAAKSDTPSNYTINSEHHIAYARLFGVYIVFANRIGVEDGVNFWGGSEIVAPDGSILARAKFFDEDSITGELDPNAVRHSREYSRHFLDENVRLTHSLLSVLVERSSS